MIHPANKYVFFTGSAGATRTTGAGASSLAVRLFRDELILFKKLGLFGDFGDLDFDRSLDEPELEDEPRLSFSLSFLLFLEPVVDGLGEVGLTASSGRFPKSFELEDLDKMPLSMLWRREDDDEGGPTSMLLRRESESGDNVSILDLRLKLRGFFLLLADSGARTGTGAGTGV